MPDAVSLQENAQESGTTVDCLASVFVTFPPLGGTDECEHGAADHHKCQARDDHDRYGADGGDRRRPLMACSCFYEFGNVLSISALIRPPTEPHGRSRIRWLGIISLFPPAASRAVVTGVPLPLIVPLSASLRQSGWVRGCVRWRNRWRGSGRWACLALTWGRVAALRFTPVVYTCGVSVLQGLRRTKAVLGGL